ncbi:MAG: hypothetical protein AB8B78_00790, partial [Polaribacter sp.]
NDTIKSSKFYTELGFTVSRFEQQVKKEVGGAKGDLISDETNFSTIVTGGYQLSKYFSIGAFVRYDTGKRFNALFDGFNAQNETIVTGRIGGNFSEVWIGPMLRLHWRQLYFSSGYALFGSRVDDARNDIKSSSGATTGSFSTHPRIALQFHLGGAIPITKKLEAFFALEYRIRYYDERGGKELVDNIILGTQNILPFAGLKLSL